MKLLLVLLISGFGIIGKLCAQTIVPAGSVSGNWTNAGSPYIIQGSIIIPNGQTLTINPGVDVIFQGSYQLFVQGRILAQGAVGDSVIFTAQDTTAGWRGIRFDNTPVTNDSSKITFCKILYGKNLNYLNNGNGGGMYINNFSKIKLSDCSFQFCKSEYNITNDNGFGGGLYSNSIISVTNSVFKNNVSTVKGGAIFLGNGGLIKDCLVQNNSSGDDGGGLFCRYTTIIDNSTVTHNTASGDGGGVSFEYCDQVQIINSILSFNISGNDGGGINGNCNFKVENCTLEGNISNSGGAIYSLTNSQLIISNIIKNNIALGGYDGGGGLRIVGGSVKKNIFENNNADKGGAVVFYGNVLMENNIFRGNNASEIGGAIYSYTPDNSIISGNLITNNSAVFGGGIGFGELEQTPNHFWNNTIVNNSATNGGAFFGTGNNSPNFKNCIIYGNTASGNGAQIYLSDQSSQPSFYNCNIQGGSAEFFNNGNFYVGNYLNNIDSNPLFISPTNGSGSSFSSSSANWRLQSASPCIDSGQAITGIPLLDLDSNFRFIGTSIDIGAYEFLTPCTITEAPTFESIGPFCQNTTPSPLPETSTNGIFGTWNPSVVSTTTIGIENYTFTPFVGQCANSNSISVNISASPNAVINQSGPISACVGDTILLSCDTNLVYSYQWYINGNPISGAVFNELNPTLSGNYQIKVTQDNCESTSSIVNVAINSLPSVPIISGFGQIISCIGGSVTLTANSDFETYSWSNGTIGNPIVVTESGDYTVSVTSGNGCNGSSQPYIVNASFMQASQICLVGLDSLANENRIIWEKPVSQGIDSFYVYKETATANVYTKIGATDYNELGLFVDANSNPSIQAYRYRISILDTCGVETNLSNFHKTIHLTINQGVGGAWNLIWNHYEGINFPSYNIYRGSDPSNISLLTTIQSNLNSYTDLTPPGGSLYYQIEVINPFDCDPAKNSGYGLSRSNISNNGLAQVQSIENFTILFYPNPTENYLNYEVPKSIVGKEYSICDLSGRKLKTDIIDSQKGTFLLNELSRGTYYITIEDLGIIEKIVLN